METTPTAHIDAIYGRGPEYSPYTAPAFQPVPPLPPLPPLLAPQRPAAGAAGAHQAYSVSPGLAFILGWIPGVGAIYNGQYAKGLVHVVIFGMIVSLLNHGAGDFEPLFGIGLGAWVFYMAFEAFHTAKKRMLGLPVEEFSSLVHFDSNSGRIPLAPIVLIALGTFFLLANFDLIRVDQILRFWPVALIGFGLYLLMGRMNAGRRP
jgi:hypothetical protein